MQVTGGDHAISAIWARLLPCYCVPNCVDLRHSLPVTPSQIQPEEGNQAKQHGHVSSVLVHVAPPRVIHAWPLKDAGYGAV
jgi:hypothetical protein